MLRKAWIIDGGIRCLLKGDYKNETLQPFNELLASEICRRLNFCHVEYEVDIYKNQVVSKCPCFIDTDTELITAHQIMDSMPKFNSKLDYENYIQVLEKNDIENAREKLENMYILDFLIMNEDRHLNNFGIIRDVNTLKWLDVAPIFDNGQSLSIQDYNDDELIISGQGKLFYEIKSFDEIIKVFKNIKRIDTSKLDVLVEWFDMVLHKYQAITGMTDRKINKHCILLNRQINRLKKLTEK